MAPLMIGHARVSTDQQDLTAQREALTARGLRWRIVSSPETHSDGLRPSRQDSFDCTSSGRPPFAQARDVTW